MAARRSAAKAAPVAKAPPTKSFNLEDKTVSGPLVRGGRTYTDEQKRDMLTDYVEIPIDLLPYIRYGEYVRYETATAFNPGGLVLKNPLVLAQGTGSKNVLQLHAGKIGAAGYKKWSIPYDDLRHVYIKPNAITRVMMRNLDRIGASFDLNLKNIRDYLGELNSRLERLERKISKH